MRTQIRVALVALLPACGAKTGLRVPDVVRLCEADPPACQEPSANTVSPVKTAVKRSALWGGTIAARSCRAEGGDEPTGHRVAECARARSTAVGCPILAAGRSHRRDHAARSTGARAGGGCEGGTRDGRRLARRAGGSNAGGARRAEGVGRVAVHGLPSSAHPARSSTRERGEPCDHRAMKPSTHPSPGALFARALALVSAMSVRLNGCVTPWDEGRCVCLPDADGGDASWSWHEGRCTPSEADAGCLHSFGVGGPLTPPELDDVAVA